MSKSQEGITWQELGSILEMKKDDAIAMLYRGFVEDSADEKKEIAVVAGGLLASHATWTPFPGPWKARLRQDGLDYFRSSDYSALSGEFAKFRDPDKYPKPKGSEAARQLRTDLDAIITKQHIIGIACVIPMQVYKEFRATVPNAAEKLNEDAFHLALQIVLMECAYIARDELPGDNNCTAFMCDESNKAPLYAEGYRQFKLKNPIIAPSMRGLVHMDDKVQPRLQAADMMAGVAKERAIEYLKSPDASALRTEEREYYGKHMELKRLKGTVYRIYILSWDFLCQLLAVQD